MPSRNRSRKRVLPLALSVCVLLGGCWDRRELNDISVVTGMAIDKGQGAPYRVSIEIVNVASLNPKRDGNLAPSVIYSLQGKSVEELFHRMNTGIPRIPILSHMRVLVIGEKLAREGSLEFIDFLQRNRETRNDFLIMVAKGGDAREVLTMTYPFQKVATSKIYRQMRFLTNEWGGDPDVRLNDLIQAFDSPGRQPVMAYVAIKGAKPEKAEDNLKSITPAFVSPTGMAVFKDLKMIGTMNLEDVRNYLWTQNGVRRTSVTVPLEKGKFMGVRIVHSKSGIKAAMAGMRPRLQVTLKLEAVIEALEAGTDLENLLLYEQLEEKVDRMLEKSVRSTVVKAQKKFGADIFGFGDALYRQHPAQFRMLGGGWDDAFARADIDIRVTTVLSRTGTIRSPVFTEMKS